ncbi:MAG: Kelch repeat-containing protein, partial [Chitinophaga sp.]
MRNPLFIILFIMFHLPPLAAQEPSGDHIRWSVPAQLPLPAGASSQPGLAGAAVGVHQQVLLIAGGANFPGAMPWEGGKKQYYGNVYTLYKNMQWAAAPAKLPFAFAYAASVGTPDGLLCIGGEDEHGPRSSVFLLQWDATAEKVRVKDMPPLPEPLTNASAAIDGNTVYVAGGENASAATHAFYSLDLTPGSKWQPLQPLPQAVSHAVTVAQSNGSHTCIYVAGGRTKNASGISTLHNTAWQYDPALREWKKLQDIPSPAISAGSGIASGATYILLFGGDKGDVFTRIESYNARIAQAGTEGEKQSLRAAKLALLTGHEGFSK